MLVVGQLVTQAGNDKQQVEPMREQLALPEALGRLPRKLNREARALSRLDEALVERQEAGDLPVRGNG